ncbi:LuxR C-terminal-related transcriptional regulator [Actinoallomurus sp. NPDC050550]|uniref:ATP-binding protein n=1 Tax=Actinoallomurus sp. NPDC050550 TaxID=3154937 RepID=UPI0033E3D580
MSSNALHRRRTSALPAELTSFVGRRQEIHDVRRLLSECRMVTLTGPGGVGKTRLSLKVADGLQRAFPDGVWFIELASLDRPELLVHAIVEALEIRDRSSRPPLDVLIEHLDGTRALIVLDNCEHLVQACAVLADALLAAVPELRILATSRQPLGIFAERTLTVPPLALPDADGGRLSTPAVSDAIRLFGDRAAAVVPEFAITDENRDVVERICHRLDGIPLALELAAVRLRALSVNELLDRLDDRFRLLSASSRAVLPRHQTLRALVGWSYGLCDENERVLWARISVFNGGLDLTAAEAVCSGDGIAEEEIVDLVTGLVEKSVLIREEGPSGVRYRLLDVIRAYGRERLAESGQEATLRRRYRDHYRRLAADACANLFGSSQVEWFTRLRADHPNLRAALEHYHADPDDAPAGLGMATDLLYYWISGYCLGEGRDWLDRGLAACPRPDAVRARALWTCAWVAIIQGDLDAAGTMLEEGRAIGQRLGLTSVQAYVALYSGMIAVYRNQVEAAIPCYREAVALHRTTGDLAGLVLSLMRLALAHSLRGESARAVAAAEEGIAVCDAHGEVWHKGYTTFALGVEVWRQGDLPRAASLEQESLRFNHALDDRLGVAVGEEVLAWIAATGGNHERAAVLMGIRQRTWQAISAPLSGYGNLLRYHDECEARVRAALGEDAFRAAVRRGAAMPDDEALAYALEQPSPSSGPSGAAPGSPLTRRETEVARLIAKGMSNRQIASALVVAERTAEGHVERILHKLGFHSRTQIARWLIEQEGTGN